LNTFTTRRSKDLRHTIHSYGHRSWTIHELALLQGCTPEYKFVGNLTQKIKQIGNAFPSKAAAVIYKACVNSLLWTDGRQDEIRLGDAIDLSICDYELSENGSRVDAFVSIDDDDDDDDDDDEDGEQGDEWSFVHVESENRLADETIHNVLVDLLDDCTI